MSLKSFGKEVINAYSQGKPVLRAYSNGKLAYRQQQEIIYSAKVKTQGAWVDIDDYLCSAKTVVKFKLFVPKNIPVLPDYYAIIGRSRGDYEFFWFAWQNGSSDRFAYYVENNNQAWLPYPTQAFDKLVNIEMSCDNIIIDDVVFAGNPSDYVAPENGIQIFAVKRGTYLDYIMGICGITIGSNIEIYDKQDDGSLVLKRNLYFVPAGDTQHSATPAPVGGACWCRVTNRYYNVLQNDGVGELEYEPISVNKNPRTEYSIQSLGNAYFITDIFAKPTTRVKFKYSFNSNLTDAVGVMGNKDGAGNDTFAFWYPYHNLDNGGYIRGTHSTDIPINISGDNPFDIDLKPTGLYINNELKFACEPNIENLNNPICIFSIGVGYTSQGAKFHSHILFYDDSTNELTNELIPVPEGDVQYSDIPAPVGGALWDRVTNKYYAKQGTGALKFTPLPRLALVSNGTQYINTGIAGNTITLASIRHEITDKTKRQLHGYDDRSTGYFGYRGASRQYELGGGSKGSDIVSNGYDILTYTTKDTMAYLAVNSIPQCEPKNKDVSSRSFLWLSLIAQIWVSANTTNAFIYVGNTLTQNLIPVKQGDTFYKKDSTPAPSNCMYDTVTDTYFENAGTGTFGITYEY